MEARGKRGKEGRKRTIERSGEESQGEEEEEREMKKKKKRRNNRTVATQHCQ